MKTKTKVIICVLLLAVIALGLIAFFGMRNNLFGIRNLLGYTKVTVTVVSSEDTANAEVHEYTTRAASLQDLIGEKADDFTFVLKENSSFDWKDEEKNVNGTRMYEIKILTVEGDRNKQLDASETVLTDKLTDGCNYLFKLYSAQNVYFGG